MSAALRILDTGLNSARWNVAMTAALAEMRRTDKIADTLRFHRYPKSVLIGRHQVLADAVHIDRCKRAQVEIARRFTGGGAVYMAPGALAWDMVITRKASGSRLDQVAAAMCEAVAAGLSRLGLAARYRPQNDVAVDDRKICGSSGYFDGETLVYQGTVLIDTKLGDMAEFLRLPSHQAGGQLRHLSERLTTVSELLGRAPDPHEIENAVAVGFADALGRNLQRDAPTLAELELAARYHDDEFGSDDYIQDIDAVTAVAAAVSAAPGLSQRASRP